MSNEKVQSDQPAIDHMPPQPSPGQLRDQALVNTLIHQRNRALDELAELNANMLVMEQMSAQKIKALEERVETLQKRLAVRDLNYSVKELPDHEGAPD